MWPYMKNGTEVHKNTHRAIATKSWNIIQTFWDKSLPEMSNQLDLLQFEFAVQKMEWGNFIPNVYLLFLKLWLAGWKCKNTNITLRQRKERVILLPLQKLWIQKGKNRFTRIRSVQTSKHAGSPIATERLMETVNRRFDGLRVLLSCNA